MLHKDLVRFALAALVTWRVTHLLVFEDGPADVIVKIRAALGDSIAGRAMDCFYCLSVWTAAPLGLVVTRTLDWLLIWPALSGLACLLERLGGGTSEPSELQPSHYEETS